MYSIKLPTGTYLEGRFALTFELNNQVFSTSDASVLPGSYSFPTAVPLTDANKIALGHPHLVTNANNWQEIEGVWVECYGVPMFYGTLKITACNQRNAKINIVSNPVRPLKDLYLPDLDLGGLRDLGADSAAARAHAKNTFSTPANYDYIFFPVLNPTFLDNPSGSDQSLFQNYYDPSGSGAFVEGSGNLAATPFIKINYLLEQIFAETGTYFTNAWQTEGELALLCLWNNRSIYKSDNTWNTELNLSNHVPKQKVNEFLKALMGVFNLGIFYNPFENKTRLVALNSLLSRATRLNWSAYHISDLSLDDPAVAPAGYAYTPADDEISRRYDRYRTERLSAWGDVLGVYDAYDDFFADTPTAGLYFVRDKGAYYYHNGLVSGVTFMWQELGAAPADYLPKGMRTPLQAFEATLLPCWENMRTYHDLGGAYIYPYTPAMEAQGIVTYTDGADTITQDPDVQHRLMFYRGTYPAIGGGTYPAGNTISYNENGDNVYSYSLRWDGQDGLNNRWWAAWHSALTGKNVTLQLALPVAELANFSFEDKVRIGSMDYFVKRLRVSKPLGRALVLVEASMVSVI